MNNHYNKILAIPLSFFSQKLYLDIAKNWRGFGFLYILMLLIICWVPSAFILHKSFETFANQQAPKIVEQIPPMTIKNGVISTPEKKPYMINANLGNDTNLTGIIDTSGQYSNLSQTKADILVTPTQIFMRSEQGEIKEYKIDSNINTEITKDTFYNYLTMFKRTAPIALYITGLIVSFIYRIIQVIIYAAIGYLIIAPIQRVALNYKQILRLASVIITPAIILSTLFELIHLNLSFQLLFYFILSMAYLVFAIHANRNTEPQPNLTVQ